MCVIPHSGISMGQCTAAIDILIYDTVKDINIHATFDNTIRTAAKDRAMRGAAIDIKVGVSTHSTGNVISRNAKSASIDIAIHA